MYNYLCNEVNCRCITEMPVIGGCFAVSLTILPNVISPTKALGGIRLKDICKDS